MNTVVEIGSGLCPGPFVEGAAVHYAVDPILDKLRDAANSPFTPLQADARKLDLADESADLVVARNVFGDPMLGMSEAEKNIYHALTNSCIERGDYGDLKEMMATAEDVIDTYKIQLAREAVRILTAPGQLVAVEQYTPMVAERFFKHTKDDMSRIGFRLDETDLADIMPASYVAAHGYRAKTWTLTKV